MKKICFLIAATLFCAATFAQTAKSVLDKAAAHITVKEGVKANFRMTGSMGNTSGSILIKGRKFHATTPVATVWFDGKTQWTYMKNNEEVNVSLQRHSCRPSIPITSSTSISRATSARSTSRARVSSSTSWGHRGNTSRSCSSLSTNSLTSPLRSRCSQARSGPSSTSPN